MGRLTNETGFRGDDETAFLRVNETGFRSGSQETPGFFVSISVTVIVRAIAAVLLISTAACAPAKPAPKQYALTGQILAVLPDRQSLTIRHEDIANLMPAMTMTYKVATPALMKERAAGELIVGTLEIGDAEGQLIAITHTGVAPIPENANELAMAEGVLTEGDAVPDAALIDQHDRRVAVSEWKGSVTLLTFIYTSCPLPDFCPLMDQNFAAVQRGVSGDAALKGRVRLVSVSIDPATDTPAVLAAHAKLRQADPSIWTFVTGDQRTVDRFAGKFGVSVVRDRDAKSIVHALRTFLVGRDGRILKIYPGNDWKPDDVLMDVREAVRKQPS